MILDMNINLEGMTEAFLNDLDELIEDTRVEYFIINPKSQADLANAQEICKAYERFKYTLPVQFEAQKDENCVAMSLSNKEELHLIQEMPLVIDSSSLNESFMEAINKKGLAGVVLDAKQSDTQLENFAYAISHTSLQSWSKEGLSHTDYNKLALQSNYPTYSYDELIDGLLKEMSDLTFRAEQTIAAGGTRTVLKTFKLL